MPDNLYAGARKWREKRVRTVKLKLEDLNAAPARAWSELLATRLKSGLAIFDAVGHYHPGSAPYLNWPGKAQAWVQAVSPTAARFEGGAPAGSHLYFEGDNLTVLKLLLPALQGKVQVIYADPPYNTGKDFVYADNFALSPSAYERLWGEDSGAGRRHAQWCSFIYPRLLLARELMADNAVIFMSIDDHECHNLKLILDEVFGAANFITQLVWQRAFAAKNDAKTVPVSHDYVLMYAKNKACWEVATKASREPQGIGLQGAEQHGNGHNGTEQQGIGRQGTELPGLGRQLLRRTLVGDSQEGTQELKRLLNQGVFDGPKPVRLIKYLLELAGTADSGIVLDFFAGSATTGQAVLELNAEDGGTRRFILVQSPEPCAARSPARQAGFSDIAQIGLKRLNAVCAQLSAASAQLSAASTQLSAAADVSSRPATARLGAKQTPVAMLVEKFYYNKDAVGGGGHTSKYMR